jgi:uncharacterized protein involved in exopolysaccharide biosynthesis
VSNSGLKFAESGELDVYAMIAALWGGRWVIAAIVSVFLIAGVSYAFMVTSTYRAETTVIPVNSRSMSSGLAQLGGIASLVGISIGPGESSQEAVAVLKSHDFARDFIQEKNLLPVLFADGTKHANAQRQPDIQDAVEYFDLYVLSVTEDKKTGLLKLAVTWSDATRSAEWANQMVTLVNDRLRSQALSEAENNIKYLRGEMASTNVPVLQQSLGKVLESEMQTLLLARGRRDFAFKVIDQAVPPKFRSTPKRRFIVLASFLVGFLVATIVVIVRKRFVREGA